ncbi:ABC transporter permease [Labedella populi]|uniref:ABC transporter permease n=1 Tax=Labedella populi TaxID=2498850 RepID=A0A3S4E6W6_9MICO|nr:ABC transporter permease [Labedella populi]RWZ64698.1 ABC transporter permease [Labedella populi]
MPSNATQGDGHFVADVEETPVGAVDSFDESSKVRTTWSDAWESMRSRPMFWISAVLILFVVIVAAFPQLFSQTDPARGCLLPDSNGAPEAGHPFGFTRQGCDVYARVIFGARASLTVGLLATILVTVVGTVLGAIAGYYGGWFDSILSRVGDIFFAIPTVLGAIVLMSVLPTRDPLTVALVLSLFAWPQIARIMRGAVLSAKNADYVQASTALGVSRLQILIRHVVPNAINPVIVVATTSLGTLIVAEATLSFLGIGLPTSIMSWGNDIGQARTSVQTAPMVLFYPAAALSVTVLSFLLMGDVVRDALDPKARARR